MNPDKSSPPKKAYGFLMHDMWSLDTASLGGIKRFGVVSLRLLHALSRQYDEGQLSMRATSLVYTTLLSMVPLLAVSFSVLKAFGVHNQIEPVLLRFLAPLGPDAPEITGRIIGFVSNMKVGVLGSVGLAFLLYTVVSVLYQIEESFNHIWKASRSRPLARRFSDYMTVLLVGPILIFSAMGLTATVMSSSVVQRIIDIGRLGVVVFIGSKLLPYVITCAAFTFAYVFIPSVKVKLRPALVGGVFAGVLWEFTGWGFANFVVTSAKYPAIYSGFAILIMFMLWVYISWLILLGGSSIAFLHQFPQYMQMREETVRLSGRMKERLAFSIMYLIGKSYRESGPAWTLDALIEKLRLPVEPVREALAQLEGRRLIVQTADDNPRYMPARDMRTIALSEILDAVRTADENRYALDPDRLSPGPVDELARKMSGALAGTVEGMTLHDLVSSDGGDKGAGKKKG